MESDKIDIGISEYKEPKFDSKKKLLEVIPDDDKRLNEMIKERNEKIGAFEQHKLSTNTNMNKRHSDIGVRPSQIHMY